jgi:hypothetical protein
MAAADVDFMYEQTDIPPGVTVSEWRLRRRPEREARPQTLRNLRERARALGAQARAVGAVVVRRPQVRDSSDAHGRIPA